MDLQLTEAEQHKQDNTKAFENKQRGKTKEAPTQPDHRRAQPYKRDSKLTHNGKDLRRVTRLSDVEGEE
jgi:hypothetical protein